MKNYNLNNSTQNTTHNYYTLMMNTCHDDGYLEVILGPMFSGKTSRIVELYNQCIFSNIPVTVINHSMDKRYSNELLSTHDLKMIPCIQSNDSLWEMYADSKYNESINESRVILINEGQFFNDLYNWVHYMVDIHHKEIYVCGLDGDFNRKMFGQMLNLIPIADKVHKLKSLCAICKNGTHAIFTMRCTSEKKQVVIGSDNYKPVCRRCYCNKSLQSSDDEDTKL